MFTYKLAQSRTDKECVLHLIQESYGLAYPGNNYRESISHPYFGDIAVHSIMLLANNRLVGTISLLYNTQNRALPTPSEFLLGYQAEGRPRPTYLPANLVEIGWLAKAVNTGLAPADEARILPMLVWLISRLLRTRQVEGFVGTVQPHLFRRLTQMGLQPVALDKGFRSETTDALGAYLNEKADGRPIIYFYCDTESTYRNLNEWSFDGYLSSTRHDVRLLRPDPFVALPIAA